MLEWLASKTKGIHQPVDNAPLVLFRAFFGFLLTAEAWGAIMTGWVKETFVEPAFTFTFIGFEWLRVFNGEVMYGWYGLMGLLGIGVMLGYRYRFCMIGYATLWHLCYLMQKTHYNNHYYLLVLLCWVMVFLPAHHWFSIDARRKPSIRSLHCPRWCLWLLIIQLWIVYTYAAIAKIYPDWMEGIPLEMWFARKTHYWLVGPLLAQPWMRYWSHGPASYLTD